MSTNAASLERGRTRYGGWGSKFRAGDKAKLVKTVMPPLANKGIHESGSVYTVIEEINGVVRCKDEQFGKEYELPVDFLIKVGSF